MNRLNSISPTMATQNPQSQQNPQGFRQEYQGVVQVSVSSIKGLQSMMTISYSVVQSFYFGKIFMEMTIKMLKYVGSSATSAYHKLLSLFKIR